MKWGMILLNYFPEWANFIGTGVTRSDHPHSLLDIRSPHCMSDSPIQKGVVIGLCCMLLLCNRGASPVWVLLLPLVWNWLYHLPVPQSVSGTKFTSAAICTCGCTLRTKCFCHGEYDGRKCKGDLIFIASGLRTLEFRHQPLHKATPYAPLKHIIPPHGEF